MDIISNARRALVNENDLPQASPLDLMLAGTWETQIETDLVGRPGATVPLSAATFKNLRVVDPAKINTNEDNGGIFRAISRDINAGYVVLANGSNGVSGLTHDARWWRVDPVTGETLGMNQFVGASATEEVYVLAFGLGLAVGSVAMSIDCMARDQGSFTQCVMCKNIIAYGIASAGSAVEALTTGSLDRYRHFIKGAKERAASCYRDFR